MVRALLLLALLVGMAAIGWSALGACGITAFGTVIANCPDAPGSHDAAAPSGPAATVATADLQRTLEELRRQLEARPPCEARAVEPPPPPDIADDAWKRQDVGSLAGCWTLSSDYRVRNVANNEVITVGSWQVCLDASGRGTQVMSLSNGSRCEADVTAKFTNDRRFEIDEAGDLACSNGFRIFRRKIGCTRREDRGIDCTAFQPQTNGSSDVRLERKR